MAILVSSLLGLGLAGAVGMRTSALILQDQNYRWALSMAIDADIATIEKKSIIHLAESFSSLAEVVLQNRIFLQ